MSDFIPIAQAFTITKNMRNGLKYCSWPGRTQILSVGSVKYFLDGAHTVESLIVCSEWFKKMSVQVSSGEETRRILIFNSTGQRDSKKLLSQLLDCQFDICIFCPNLASRTVEKSSDQANLSKTMDLQISQCKENCSNWIELSKMDMANVKIFHCLKDVVDYVETLACQRAIHILATGSLHLVGTLLSIIDPDLQQSTKEHRILE